MSHATGWRRTVQWVAAGLFLVALWLSPLQGLLDFAPEPRRSENRRLAPWPVLGGDWRSLAADREQIDAYFTDHFGFRRTLVRWHNLVRLRLFGRSPVRQVVVGQDGWLFLGRDDPLDNFRPARPMSPRALERWRTALVQRHEALARRGIRFLVVLVPDKRDVYPPYLPATVRQSAFPTRIDQFTAYLRSTSAVETINLLPALRLADPQWRTYDRTDTHWNDLGAFVAYEEIAASLRRWYPALRVRPRSAFTLRSSLARGGNLARMLAMGDVFEEERITFSPTVPTRVRGGRLAVGGRRGNALTVMEQDAPHLPRALVLHDSLGERLKPYLAEHFSRIVFARGRKLDRALVEREQPQVVIQEIGARALDEPERP